MGLDWGEKNIGVAISDPLGLTAQPLTVLKRTNLQKDIQHIGELCQEYDVEELVIGYPLNMDASRGEVAEQVEQFKHRLLKLLPVQVHLWDERLTSARAEQTLLEADVSREKRKLSRDKLAASMILDSFLRARSIGRENMEEE